MRDFICPNCGQRLAFENSVCLSCNSRLGFSLEQMAFFVIADEDTEQSGVLPASQYQLCANLHLAECNWLVPVQPVRQLCQSCVLTRTRPNDVDVKALAAFAAAERAKRRLIAELHELKLPIVGLGPSPEYVKEFTELFGDPDEDYQAALDRHYSEGPPQDWKKNFVSSYATMHAAEDWAETFAHYLHIRDTLDTSAAFSFAPAAATYERRALGRSGFDAIIEMWLPLAWALNMVNRSMGKDDLYPFVLTRAVLNKMRFIYTVIDEVTSASDNLAAV